MFVKVVLIILNLFNYFCHFMQGKKYSCVVLIDRCFCCFPTLKLYDQCLLLWQNKSMASWL